MNTAGHQPRRAIVRNAMCVALCMALYAALPAAQAQTTAATKSVHRYDIPAGPLSSALSAWGAQSDKQVVYAPKLVTGKRTKGATGRYSAPQALTQLLAGTALAWRRVNSQTYALKAAPPKVPAPPTNATESKHVQTHHQQKSVTALGAIVVNANKRLENIQKVPISMSAISASALLATHATSFDDYLTGVPGVTVTSQGPGFTRITIRGISSGSVQENSQVATYLDNVPLGTSSTFAEGGLLTPDIAPTTLERVVVLRGPQGTLYGANSLGGLVKFVTLPPDTHDVYGHLTAAFTDLVPDGGAGFLTRAMINLPIINDTLALSASAFKRKRPGYVTNITSGLKNGNYAKAGGGQVQLIWTPTNALSLRFFGLSQRTHGPNLSSLGTGFANNGVDIDPRTLKPLYGQFKSKHPIGTGPLYERTGIYYINLSYDMGWAQLVSTTSYNTIRMRMMSDQSLDGGAGINQTLGRPVDAPIGFSMRVSTRKKTQELRLQSAGVRKLDWRIGLFYTHEWSANNQTLFALDKATGAPITPASAIFNSIASPDIFIERAVYGDITWHVTQKLNVLVGARATHDYLHYTQKGTEGFLNAGLPLVISAVNTDSPTTFTFSPSYQLTPNVMLYGRIASGFQTGGTNASIPPGIGAPRAYGPDKLVNYEVGFKSTLLNGRMILDADTFYINWKSIQLSTIKNGFNYVGNVGHAKSKGVEVEWKYRIAGGLTAGLAGSWTKATLADDTPPGIYGLKGMRLPYVPSVTGNASLSDRFPIGGGWSGNLRGVITYTGSRETDFASTVGPRFVLPSYTILSVYGGVNHGAWTFDAYVKNVGNSHGLISMQAEGDIFSAPYSATYVLPRLVGVNVDYEF